MTSKVFNKKFIKKITELILFTRSSDESKDPQLHPFTLRFIGRDVFLEEEYKQFFKKSYRSQTIFGHIMGLIFYSGFSLLDLVLVPEYANYFIFIRLAVVVPLIFFSLILIITNATGKYIQFHLAIIMLIVGVGIVAMIAIGGPTVSSMYYPGLILVFIFAFTFVGLHFIWATISTVATVLIFEAVSIYIQVPWVMFIGNNFFLISTFVFSMIAGYSIEYYRRKE